VLQERLGELLREEELKWYQRAKVKQLLEGNANTKFYHLVANGRHRKTRIFQLEDGNKLISGDAELKKPYYHILQLNVWSIGDIFHVS